MHSASAWMHNTQLSKAGSHSFQCEAFLLLEDSFLHWDEICFSTTLIYSFCGTINNVPNSPFYLIALFVRRWLTCSSLIFLRVNFSSSFKHSFSDMNPSSFTILWLVGFNCLEKILLLHMYKAVRESPCLTSWWV